MSEPVAWPKEGDTCPHCGHGVMYDASWMLATSHGWVRLACGGAKELKGIPGCAYSVHYKKEQA